MPKTENLTIVGASTHNNRDCKTKPDTPDTIYFDGVCSQQAIEQAAAQGDFEFSSWVPQDVRQAIIDTLTTPRSEDHTATVFLDISPFSHQIDTAYCLNGHHGPPRIDNGPAGSYPIRLQGFHSQTAVKQYYPGCHALCTRENGRAITIVEPKGFRPKVVEVEVITNGQLQPSAPASVSSPPPINEK